MSDERDRRLETVMSLWRMQFSHLEDRGYRLAISSTPIEITTPVVIDKITVSCVVFKEIKLRDKIYTHEEVFSDSYYTDYLKSVWAHIVDSVAALEEQLKEDGYGC